MNVELIQMPPIRVAMIRHTGPYEDVGGVFDQLWDWVKISGAPARRSIGIYWDNPDEVPASQLRAAACVEIPPHFSVTNTYGAPVTEDQIAGGAYAKTKFVGPYEALAPVWAEFTAYIEGQLRRTISSNPAFEVYVNDPSDTPANQLITELYMPLA